LNLGKRLTVIASLLLATVGCDQATKSLASSFLKDSTIQSYFYDTLRIGYYENIGAFLGLGNTLPEQTRFWIFTFSVGVFYSAFWHTY
jgi:signal peptidase II